MNNILNSSSSSSSSSADSDYLLNEINFRKEKSFQERLDDKYYDDEEFRRRFRFYKNTFNYICTMLEADLDHEHLRGGALTVKQQIMVALRYYATGSFQMVIGDITGIHQSTVCRSIHIVSRSIARKLNQFIRMPVNIDEVTRSMTAFYEMKRIPRCVGCIDCSHI